MDKDVLYDLYINQKKSLLTISKELGCSVYCVYESLKKFNIQIRPSKFHSVIDDQTIYDLYVNKGFSKYKINKMFPNCGPYQIQNAIEKCGIKLRSPQKGLPKIHIDKDELYDLYINKEMSSCEIVEYFQNKDKIVSAKTVLRKLREYGIPTRTQDNGAKTQRRRCYENGVVASSKQQRYIHEVVGGILNYPYEFANLDIAFPDEDIYVEYDGGGHRLSIVLGSLTEEQFNRREKNRFSFLSKKWKCIKIISSKDRLPIRDILLKLISDARIFLRESNEVLYTIDFDNFAIYSGTFYQSIENIEIFRVDKIEFKIDKPIIDDSNVKLKIINEIISMLSNFNLEIQLFSDFSVDLFFPRYNFAIDINESYSHSEAYLDHSIARKLHLNKTNFCLKHGIRLLHIFEHSWYEKKDQIFNVIKSILVNPIKIDARKCQLNNDCCNSFLEKNHLQGSYKGILKYFNLEYNNEIVATMTASRHHRKIEGNFIVLNRLCFKDGIIVRGGASRLFNQFKKWAIDNHYDNIISWSDNCISQGNIYEILGFHLADVLNPDYFYYDINHNCYMAKQSQKKCLTKCPPEITESDWAQQHGLFRIWDCGKKRWIYDLNQ